MIDLFTGVAVPLTFQSEEVRAHLSGLRETVSRLANNSAQCKTWAVTVTGGLLALTLEKGIIVAVALSLIPIVVFACLDAYYLSLERRIRNRYIEFADAVRDKNATPGSAEALIFSFGSTKTDTSITSCFLSGSVLIFYVGLVILVLLVFLVAYANRSPEIHV
jgi:hypothetical protein